MNKTKKKFIERVDTINIKPDFNRIRHQINYKECSKIDIPKKRNLALHISLTSISFVFLCLLIGVVSIQLGKAPYKNNLEKDFRNLDLKLESYSEDVLVSDENIYINYSMVAKACNLTNELFFTSGSWEVYQDGEKQDKTNVELTYGKNTFDIVLYKLNEVEEDYKLEITVGK